MCNFLQQAQKQQCKVFSIGKSVLGKQLWAVSISKSKSSPWALVVAGMHAREHLSTDLVCLQISDILSKKYKSNVNICFVPLINPDGADLCLHGADGLPPKEAQKLININGGKNFSLYKANARGVDLNNNFAANWKQHYGDKRNPCSCGFYGYKPLSEPESLALANFTKSINPFITISYHLKGEEIYFDFFQPASTYCRDKRIAQIFAKSTKYKIVSTQGVSSGGYKDWCVQKLGISALTIELGADRFTHPVPHFCIDQIYQKNKYLVDCLNRAYKIYLSKPTN